MPKSKSKRRTYQPPPKPKPPPSPPWVPVLFFISLGLGFASILARYVLATVFPILDSPWMMIGGLILIGGAFGVATRWR